VFYFGLYHWRVRFRRGLVGALVAALGLVGLRCEHSFARVVGAGLFVLGCHRSVGTLRSLLSPPPWHVERWKYEELAATLPLDSAGTVVDVGCGTGRSLVGLAPSVAKGATVVALDVFDDRVILGNSPALARHNAARAGTAVDPVRGDAVALPLRDGSVDVLTACRVLHDLPREDAGRALSEARRVLSLDGVLGVLELPIPHEDGADPGPYWHDLVTAAGFEVDEERDVDGYFVVRATPGAD
jgi:SAM-dependent methyltransferase